MSDGRGHGIGSHGGRVLWLLLVSPLVCTVVGSLFGGGYLAFCAARFSGVTAADAVRGLPVAMLHSVLLAGPLGVVAGLLGAALAGGLGRGRLKRTPLKSWLIVGAGAGGVPGLLVALYFGMSGGGLGLGLTTVAACATAGGAVGWLAWREFGSAVGPERSSDP